MAADHAPEGGLQEVSFLPPSPSGIIDDISAPYGPLGSEHESEALEWALSQTLKQQVTSWCTWFTDNHPPGSQPREIADAKQWDVDFRVFFIAFPISGARLLRLAEACYGIDRALCGATTITSQEAKTWRKMDQFEYIMSEDLISRWKIGLCQFQETIEQDPSSELAISIRVHDLRVAASALVDALQGDFWDYVLTHLEEQGWMVSFRLQRSIETREKLVSLSLAAVDKSVEAVKNGEYPNPAGRIVSDKARANAIAGFQDQALLNEGIRKRIPHNTAVDNTAANLEPSENRTAPGQSNSSILPETSASITRTPTRRITPSIVETLRNILRNFHWSPRRNSVPNRVLDFFIHKSTTLVLTICFVAASVGLIAVSISRTQPPDSSHGESRNGDFYATLSQAVLSIVAVYLTALPPLRSRTLHLRYKSWFWGLSLISVLAAIVSLGIYQSQSKASVMLGYVTNFAQVINTSLLIECVEEAAQAGSIGGIEMD